jgi:hypothetical protein
MKYKLAGWDYSEGSVERRTGVVVDYHSVVPPGMGYCYDSAFQDFPWSSGYPK